VKIDKWKISGAVFTLLIALVGSANAANGVVGSKFIETAREASGLIDIGRKTKRYDNYIEARTKLEKAERLAAAISDPEKRALSYLALAYSFAQMKNDYTKSHFNASQWSPDVGVKAPEEKTALSTEWTNISESARLLDKALKETAFINPVEKTGDYFLLAAVGYESLRAQAHPGVGNLSSDSLHNKALRYLVRAYDLDCSLMPQDRLAPFLPIYRELDPWKISAVVADDVLNSIVVALLDANMSASGETSFFNRVRFVSSNSILSVSRTNELNHSNIDNDGITLLDSAGKNNKELER